MEYLNNKVEEILKSAGIVRGDNVFEKSFKTITFSIIDPLNNELLKEYKFNLKEFEEKSYTDRLPFKNLPSKTEFDKEAYEKEVRWSKNLTEIYETEFNKILIEVMEKENVTKKELVQIDKILRTITTNFEIDTYFDQSSFELDILNILRINVV